jgi:signal transduction histidine kinase
MLYNHLTEKKVRQMNRDISTLIEFYSSERNMGSTTRDLVFRYLKSVDTVTGCRIWVVDEDGNLVMNTADENLGDSKIIVEDFNPAEIRGYMVGDFYGYFDRTMISVYAPLHAGFKLRGYLIMHCTESDIIDDENEALNVIYLMMLIIFFLSLIILAFFTVFIYRPLKRITYVTEEYAKGHYETPIEVSGDDEIGYLAQTLGFMASEIGRSEDNQKKFIANVSHDFRSPLTSIRGYLEAMIDGTIPPEMHEHYLQVVLNETDRLTKLTNGLLTLNNIGSGMMLEKAEFDINKVIRDTAATFEGTCRSKMIAIELVLTDEQMIVLADMGKIQQVLYNLMDNAIKFSHNDSVIKIETTEKKNKIFVSVKDSGIGIPKEDQKMVFERFYKSDLSRGKDKKGTGLGLSIVKEIIKAHGENINVISTVGVGTEFVFSLPKAKVMDEDIV